MGGGNGRTPGKVLDDVRGKYHLWGGMEVFLDACLRDGIVCAVGGLEVKLAAILLCPSFLTLVNIFSFLSSVSSSLDSWDDSLVDDSSSSCFAAGDSAQSTLTFIYCCFP